VTIAYLDMLFRLGRGGERATRIEDAGPPALEPSAPVVWNGGAGRPFIVSDRAEQDAIAELRKRSLVSAAFGAALLAWMLYEVVGLF
jgi:hypothetical protein